MNCPLTSTSDSDETSAHRRSGNPAQLKSEPETEVINHKEQYLN